MTLSNHLCVLPWCARSWATDVEVGLRSDVLPGAGLVLVRGIGKWEIRGGAFFTREDVLADEVATLPVSVIFIVRYRDGLDRDLATWFESTAKNAEVLGQVLVPDRLCSAVGTEERGRRATGAQARYGWLAGHDEVVGRGRWSSAGGYIPGKSPAGDMAGGRAGGGEMRQADVVHATVRTSIISIDTTAS